MKLGLRHTGSTIYVLGELQKVQLPLKLFPNFHRTTLI